MARVGAKVRAKVKAEAKVTMPLNDMVLYLRAQGWTGLGIAESYPEVTSNPWIHYRIQGRQLAKRGFTVEEYAARSQKPIDVAILDLVSMEQRGILACWKPGPGTKKGPRHPIWFVVPKVPTDENGQVIPMRSPPAIGYEQRNIPTRRTIPVIRVCAQGAKDRLLKGR